MLLGVQKVLPKQVLYERLYPKFERGISGV